MHKAEERHESAKISHCKAKVSHVHTAHAQAEVLVCAKGGGGLLKERMALAALLWEAGIRTELVHSASPSQTAQYEYAGARHIHWLVTINAATFSTTDTVRVRFLPLPLCSTLPVTPNKWLTGDLKSPALHFHRTFAADLRRTPHSTFCLYTLSEEINPHSIQQL